MSRATTLGVQASGADPPPVVERPPAAVPFEAS